MGKLIVVGDRVLIAPNSGERETRAGLVLPASVAEKEKVRSGRVVSVGPGYATANPEFSEGDIWKQNEQAVRYLPLQARAGDVAFFLARDAVDITYEETSYVIVQHNAILALVREDGDDILSEIENADDIEGLE